MFAYKTLWVPEEAKFHFRVPITTYRVRFLQARTPEFLGIVSLKLFDTCNKNLRISGQSFER